MTTPPPDELRALSRLAFGELRAGVGGIRAMHGAIADRAFGATGPGGRPAQVMHDAIASAAYGAVRDVSAAVGRATDAALALRRSPDERELSTTARGGALLAAVTGLRGDALAREGSPLHEPMTVRVDGRAVAVERAALAAAFPRATAHVVVFVHGLMENERAWARDGETYGRRLARELGCTPLDVRYNSGLPIVEGGRSLSELLEAVVGAWPVEVERIALVGHSMGGLVCRSACHEGSEAGAAWVRRVRHTVALGAPHFGAPLEQAVNLLSATLAVAPETRVLAALLRRRSAGIRDLRNGALAGVPLLGRATHCFVAATVTRSPTHPVGRLIGDWLVLVPSASGRGRGRDLGFRAEHGLLVGGTTHLGLLSHPEVSEHLLAWLSA
jgi:pimeloyl-ACP methyl ester carboxylesterase